MNTLPFRMSPLRLSATALLAGLSLAGVSCTTPPPLEPDGNVFVTPEGQNRFGYGGSESPNRPAPRTESRPRTPDKPKKSTKPISRDPNETTVDITPPEPKERTKPADVEDRPVEKKDPPVEVEKKEEPKTVAPPAEKKEDLPYGTPVVGKKGLVYSPYAPDKGGVDVGGIPAGTKVKCPYTGKAFRVP